MLNCSGLVSVAVSFSSRSLFFALVPMIPMKTLGVLVVCMFGSSNCTSFGSCVLMSVNASSAIKTEFLCASVLKCTCRWNVLGRVCCVAIVASVPLSFHVLRSLSQNLFQLK